MPLLTLISFHISPTVPRTAAPDIAGPKVGPLPLMAELLVLKLTSIKVVGGGLTVV